MTQTANMLQVKDLPRDMMIGVTCTACGRGWGESVRGLIERRQGVQFMDLLEWQARCACGGAVSFAYAGKPAAKPVAAVVANARPKLPPVMPFPVKAVVKRRVATPQYQLPMSLPAVADRRVRSVARAG